MNSPRVKVLLSILHRREIAALLPELTSVLSLDSQNGRVVALTVEQAGKVLHAIRSDQRPKRGIVQWGLEDAYRLIQDSLKNSQGIGSIPVGQRVYQFKITMLDHSPAIWRRIQVKSCTLDRLHEHLQTAMGWTNSHLHQFHIDGERWGDPKLLSDGFEDEDLFYNSLTAKLDRVLPKSGERFTF